MAAAGDAVWAQLRDGAARAHAPRRTLVVLGERGTGKSTLLDHLTARRAPPLDGALDYAYVDVRAAPRADAPDAAAQNDDAHLATHLYVLHASAQAVGATLPYAFPPVHEAHASLPALRSAAAVVVLDWSAPWTFAAHLVQWLALLRTTIDNATSPAPDDDRAAMQQSLAAALPAADDAAHARPAGQLVENTGVPLVVVLAKADAIARLVDDRRVSEAQLDYVQQTVRTVAARYGAAVVSTSAARPASLDALRACVRGALQRTPVALTASTNDPAALVVPPGWDTWSKIGVLDASFDCAATADAWAAALDGDGAFAAAYAARVPAPADETPQAADVVRADEQAFLAQLYAQQPAPSEPAPTSTVLADGARNALGPPVGTSTLDMPAVGQALAAQQAAPGSPEAPGAPLDETPTRTRHSTRPDARGALSPRGGASTATSPKQTEVLHSFFQSLLKKPTSTGSTAGTPDAPGTPGTPRARLSRQSSDTAQSPGKAARGI
ncbi:tubulin-dependent ATPase kip3 [Malassezia furfur]|uniref:Tubulin-dependent ATPase kip3 n=1 Tax=Malassezia furfur TaxID=55194 RepID=A0ABY8EW38_MALFU|nr:tubulin-dependent ATPase kip3 [Malassezia furfur]